MNAIVNKTRRFLISEDGPTAVEYAVMLALIVVACVTVVTNLGKSVSGTFSSVSSCARQLMRAWPGRHSWPPPFLIGGAIEHHSLRGLATPLGNAEASRPGWVELKALFSARVRLRPSLAARRDVLRPGGLVAAEGLGLDLGGSDGTSSSWIRNSVPRRWATSSRKRRPFGHIKQRCGESLSLASHRSRYGQFRLTNTSSGSAGNDRYG